MFSPHKRIPGLTAGLALLIGVASQVHCGGTPLGTMKVPFQFSFGGCADYDVDLVTVTLTPIEEDAEVNEVLTEMVTCETGQAEFIDIAIGMYRVSVEGMAADGVVVVDSIDAGSKQAEVLDGTETVSDLLELGPTPAKMRLYWALNKDGKQSMCGDGFIDTFTVNVFPQMGSTPMFEHTYNCTDEGDDDLYRTAPDPVRTIEGSQASYAVVEYFNAAGDPLGGQLEACFTPVGHGRNIEIDLTCNDDVCEITSAHTCTP